MPQWVINSGPEAFSFVPVMLAVACFTTVPVSPVMLSPGRHRLNSDGTGATVATPVGASMAMPAAFGLPPLATSTMSACRGASPSAAKLMTNRLQPLAPSGVTRLTLWPVSSLTPLRSIRRSRVPTISMASCEAGNTQPSGCATSLTPSASNHCHASAGPNSLSSRFISFSPRGYTEARLRTLSNVFVRLQRPPPVTETLASGFRPLSYTVTSAVGQSRFICIEAKHPAAPAPIIAIFIVCLVVCFSGRCGGRSGPPWPGPVCGLSRPIGLQT